ncbi:MAG: outer membrane protein assembly factor BamB family protein [Pirellulaceae bacterium]
MRNSCVLHVLIGVIGVCCSAQGADWPQWRGPDRNGISQETGLLAEWPPEGPTLVWQVQDLGGGYSTPSVVGSHLCLLGNQGTSDEFVEARTTADGQKVWSTRIGKVGNPDQRPNYPAARSTPTIVGDHLYALGSDGDMVCLETQSGKVQWQRNVRTDFGGQAGEWAYAESPLVDGDVVVCTPGGAEATLVALNRLTGAVVWKCALPGGDPAGYASIIVVESEGVKQYVQFLGKGLVGVEAATGKFLWRYDRTGTGPANIQTPLAQDTFVYSGGARSGGALVRLTTEQGQVRADEVYFDMGLPTGIGGVIQVGPNLFGASGAGVLCIDFRSGKTLWTSRSPGPGSFCYADGRLYFHGENGDVALIEPTPDEYREHGRFTPPNQPDRGTSKAWSYPVVAHGRLYIRDLNALWCYNVKAE